MRRRHAFHAKHRGTKGRGVVGDVHVHAKDHAKPDIVKAQLQHDGQEQRHGQEENPYPVKEASQEDPDDLHKNDRAPGAKVHCSKGVLNKGRPAGQTVAPDDGLSRKEKPGQHATDSYGFIQGVAQIGPIQPSVGCSGRDSAQDQTRHDSGQEELPYGAAGNAPKRPQLSPDQNSLAEKRKNHPMIG